MSHVFQRGAAYYTPTTGVVDVITGQQIAESEAGIWKSPCGTLVFDENSVARWVSDGIVGPLPPCALAEIAAAEGREAAEGASDDEGVEQDGAKGPPEDGETSETSETDGDDSASDTGAGETGASDAGASAQTDKPAKPAPKPAAKPGRGGRRS